MLLLFSIPLSARAGDLPGQKAKGQTLLPPVSEMIVNFTRSTGLFSFFSPGPGNEFKGVGNLFMIGVGLLLLYLAIKKNFEPLLLVPIGFGAILSNTPLAFMSDPGGVLYYIYTIGIKTGVF
ncbi:MAG: sodium ion-translocating decarboxylase subunit beta, partial [Proteobacteria bacterium]|nr:sodium ion-translocating decarboxylase subunit beta [Pseudomonadota bacterium]